MEYGMSREEEVEAGRGCDGWRTLSAERNEMRRVLRIRVATFARVFLSTRPSRRLSSFEV